MEHGLVTDIAICIIAAWVVAVVSQVARQPLLLAYLAPGFAIGPHGCRGSRNTGAIQTISEIGLSLLLFMIGLEIDLKKMLSAGRVITLTAGAQILGCVLLGWMVFGLLGPAQNHLEALYLAVAAAMSSTVIIVKILYDKRELETLAGRITLGVLVLQDIATILFLAVQPNLKNPAVGPLVLRSARHPAAVGGVSGEPVCAAASVQIHRAPAGTGAGRRAGVVFCDGGFRGLSQAVTGDGRAHRGRDVQHVSLHARRGRESHQPARFLCDAVFRRPRHEDTRADGGYILWTLFLCLVLIVSRLVTVFPVLYSMRQGYRVSLLPAINLCQMSELSLVLLALGKASGDVSDNVIGVAAFAFAFLAIGSTYAILGNDTLLRKATPLLHKMDLHDLDHTAFLKREDAAPRRICLLGFCWTASSLLAEIERHRAGVDSRNLRD